MKGDPSNSTMSCCMNFLILSKISCTVLFSLALNGDPLLLFTFMSAYFAYFKQIWVRSWPSHPSYWNSSYFGQLHCTVLCTPLLLLLRPTTSLVVPPLHYSYNSQWGWKDSHIHLNLPFEWPLSLVTKSSHMWSLLPDIDHIRHVF